ncbi:MAG: hypothetical protein IPK50_05800 [Fibrobacterota bacterium]|nr:hypothetical protein [Fibrobacterota bacterium]QQS06409.1 MAG: hypothetical protein IPK50_05800 [Fibrobacterota bacterium]
MSRLISIILALAIFSSVGCKPSADHKPSNATGALGFKQGIFRPDSSMTLAQLAEESKKPNFVEKYLGKRITLTQLKPTGTGEILEEGSQTGICGNFYKPNDTDYFGLTVWFNTEPKNTILPQDDTFFAPSDSIAAAGILTLPFDVCTPQVVYVCGYPNDPRYEVYKCPFDFKKLSISGLVAGIYPGTKIFEVHLVPTGLSD